MINKNFKFLHLCFLWLILSLPFSCSKKSENSGSNPPAPAPIGPTATPTPTPTGGGNGGTSDGVSCLGTSEDGEYDNHSGLNRQLIIHRIALGGQASWLPGYPSYRPEDREFLPANKQASCDPLACNKADMWDPNKRSNSCYYCLKSGTSVNATYSNVAFAYPIPLMKDMWSHSNNDGDIFFRVKIHKPYESINLNGYGGAFCYGRKPSTSGNYVPYPYPSFTKIRVNAYARVIRKLTNCDIATTCKESDFQLLSTRYNVNGGQPIEIEVDKCSPVFRLPFSKLALSNTGADAVVVELAEVQTNVSCSASSGAFCALNQANCWFATIQIANNETHFFKGLVRSQIPYAF